MSYEETTSCKDICPCCQLKAVRVYGQPFDSKGKQDKYVCDECQLIWPTEWAIEHERVIQHN